MAAPVKFAPRELELMQILWRGGPQTAREIREQVKDDLADPTVRTMLRILEEKGAVRHSKRGRAFVYKAKAPVEKTLNAMLDDIVEGFFQGSADKAAAYLMKRYDLTPAQVKNAEASV